VCSALNLKDFSDSLRKSVWLAIKELEDKKVFIHSEPLRVRLHGKLIKLPLISTLATLNALVARGSMLLYGGYGGGKTTLVKVLGRLLTGESIREIESSIIRAHPQLTEEKVVGRLDVGKLLTEGAEKIVWRNFISSFWKIIDEINRLSPSAQDAIFSILSEGIAKYFDGIYETKEYVFYATVNPRDIGSYPLGMPLLDRFGIAVPISMPRYDEIADIAEVPDDKLVEWDDSIIPAFLSKDQLIVIWNLVSRVDLDVEAKLFIGAIVREFSACIRTLKELGTFLDFAESICKGCHFNTENAICNKIHTPLSVRAGKALVRYSKALSWLLGLDTVPVNVVYAVAPYIIWHRVHLSSKFLEKFHGNRFEAVRSLIDTAFRNFINRLPVYYEFMKLETGNSDINLINELEKSAASDLIVATDLYPIAKQILENNYLELVRSLVKAINNQDTDRVHDILKRAINEIPNNLRGRLFRVYEKLIRRNRKVFVTDIRNWEKTLDKLIELIPSFREIKNEPLDKHRIKRIKINLTEISVHFTGSMKNAPVFVEVYGLGNMDEIADKIGKFLKEVPIPEQERIKELGY